MPRKAKPTRPRPVSLAITLCGFEDGVAYVDRPLMTPDRWAMQAADSLTLRIGAAAGSGRAPASITLTLAQHPRALAPARAGVGAVLWPGALALAAALVGTGLPSHSRGPCMANTDLAGALAAAAGAAGGGGGGGPHVLELGAGAVGLPSLVAAALGGAATATDRAAVLPLLAANAAAMAGVTGGRVECAALDWGEAGAVERAAGLVRATGGGGASPHHTTTMLILAADCVYCDPGDPAGTPDAGAFVDALAAAVGASAEGAARAWVAVEPRSSSALSAFASAAGARFASVVRLPPPRIVEPGFALDHIHLYELRGVVGGAVEKEKR